MRVGLRWEGTLLLCCALSHLYISIVGNEVIFLICYLLSGLVGSSDFSRKI